jgi:hypothetical protein
MCDNLSHFIMLLQNCSTAVEQSMSLTHVQCPIYVFTGRTNISDYSHCGMEKAHCSVCPIPVSLPHYQSDNIHKKEYETTQWTELAAYVQCLTHFPS